MLALVEQVKAIKAEGVKQLKKGMYELSMAEYQKCINLIDQYEESSAAHPVLTFQKAGCLNNIALCYKNVQ